MEVLQDEMKYGLYLKPVIRPGNRQPAGPSPMHKIGSYGQNWWKLILKDRFGKWLGSSV